jgi:hypothetical protein
MTSPAPRDFHGALAPGGQLGTVQTFGNQEVQAELLAVHDSALIVLSDRVAVAFFRDIARVRFGSFEWPALRDALRAPPSAEALQNARSLSRYPFGIPDDALARLLRATSQTAPDTLRAAR